ncbi:DUF1476 domain-containing protein [Ahrensia sp. R2A130]|uniref:DUF1476 domain-containing protein n=1 Tax=Ahrensia sp. R2A130 TaxID=744979 RepID=UPI0001E0B46B|nr:DUF1476 domain-containing protein [Ahrensia sp. R2A130]EFL90152.1 HpcH/HpaI aldolase [Ahrensia sp. R2A130]
MSSMDDRGDAYENKFAHDAELKFKSEARRNKMIGHWAAEKMGHADPAAYAKEVILADFEEAGDEDVFRKLRSDLDASSATVSDDELRAKMREFLIAAAEEIQGQ